MFDVIMWVGRQEKQWFENVSKSVTSMKDSAPMQKTADHICVLCVCVIIAWVSDFISLSVCACVCVCVFVCVCVCVCVIVFVIHVVCARAIAVCVCARVCV